MELSVVLICVRQSVQQPDKKMGSQAEALHCSDLEFGK